MAHKHTEDCKIVAERLDRIHILLIDAKLRQEMTSRSLSAVQDAVDDLSSDLYEDYLVPVSLASTIDSESAVPPEYQGRSA